MPTLAMSLPEEKTPVLLPAAPKPPAKSTRGAKGKRPAAAADPVAHGRTRMLQHDGAAHGERPLPRAPRPVHETQPVLVDEGNVVWLDQPTTVGFTYGDEVDVDNNEDNVGENIYYFLQGYFAKHPELAGRDFYITGESLKLQVKVAFFPG
ncbi:hypothetical protein PHYPSEUDO_013735 [Phytophthora pseudosyringae]|uniref:Uncharacterized protein n=1 Tax=Phytophthora pseudosyringae TaxID=221518 RepID=A0A8T1W6A5_9STRA|nr:hypothetical protein PHYPSEUDO_013735 [Phytophthora pseudosyringae]